MIVLTTNMLLRLAEYVPAQALPRVLQTLLPIAQMRSSRATAWRVSDILRQQMLHRGQSSAHLVWSRTLRARDWRMSGSPALCARCATSLQIASASRRPRPALLRDRLHRREFPLAGKAERSRNRMQLKCRHPPPSAVEGKCHPPGSHRR
jgi:hypothetical protein